MEPAVRLTLWNFNIDWQICRHTRSVHHLLIAHFTNSLSTTWEIMDPLHGGTKGRNEVVCVCLKLWKGDNLLPTILALKSVVTGMTWDTAYPPLYAPIYFQKSLRAKNMQQNYTFKTGAFKVELRFKANMCPSKDTVLLKQIVAFWVTTLPW